MPVARVRVVLAWPSAFDREAESEGVVKTLLIIALMLVVVPLVALLGFLGWVCASLVSDVIEARRIRENERAVRDAIERSGRR
jgi:hypothetical protein